jgi:hypothetical protein
MLPSHLNMCPSPWASMNASPRKITRYIIQQEPQEFPFFRAIWRDGGGRRRQRLVSSASPGQLGDAEFWLTLASIFLPRPP